MTDNRFVPPGLAGTPFSAAVEMPGIVFELMTALDQAGEDPAIAAAGDQLQQVWSQASPQARSGLLLNVAWDARTGPIPSSGTGTVGMYVHELLQTAADHTGNFDAFHGPGFPTLPCPGTAGVIATGLGFDRDNLRLSLDVVLSLLTVLRRSETVS
ncbi:hypothetical protein F1D05_10170 [Kribbella qitaiheensis]|uniref:Uncharacterized protein n=1 Tax=Kribbella qitaiheensis TaxID=1544730 RepID=A0A7G6WW28_9ACTN|nr:hypothetical protein [Kribbella qitaiheensis]QNE18193.1 hypothetical protein F1D05_10170 [Kribbella qitaiheensis]